MKVQYPIYLYVILYITSTIINVECSETFVAVKNDTVNSGLMFNVREIKQAGKSNAVVTNRPIPIGGKANPKNPPKQNNLPKQNNDMRKSPAKVNAVPQNYKPPLETMIIVGNQKTQKAEIYKLRFMCTDTGCTPNPVQLTDLVWSSPVTEEISEVKAVMYKGKSAVLASRKEGVIVYEYPSGTVLFRKEFDFRCGIHSAEVLPDGNVIAACSRSDGRFGILYPAGNNYVQTMSATKWINDAVFAHGVVYQNKTGLVYAGGYLTILIMTYDKGELTVTKKISIDQYYDEPNKTQGDDNEDGIHDMYPVDGDLEHLYVTTGEHVFLFSVKDYSLTRHPNFYTIPSVKSQQGNIKIKDKGGIKAISRDAKANVVIAKSAPWFIEIKSGQYDIKGTVVLWSMPTVTNNNGFCHKPDYDLTEMCKIKFQNQLYRVYKLPSDMVNKIQYSNAVLGAQCTRYFDVFWRNPNLLTN